MNGYPKWFTKNWIHTIFTLSFVSGALLLPTFLVLKLEWDLPWRLSVDQRDWIVVLHVVMGFVVFTLLGALSSIHMRMGFRKKSKRFSGVALILFILGLAATGLGVLYTGDEQLSLRWGVLHALFGGTMILIYGCHLLQKLAK